MGIWSFVSGLFKPVTELIGKVVTKEADILQIEAAIAKAQNETVSKMMDYEARILEAKARVIESEAKGASWLQRAWRPITMLTFLGLVVADTFGLTTFRLATEAWALLKIGLGGYVIGRSAEKMVPNVIKSLKASSDK